MPRPPIASSQRSSGDRPTVLLVDDDAGILQAISRTVAPDFEVVSAVTDGYQAVDAVSRLAPDVVVLDISMPGLSGFQTAEALKRAGSNARVVFLTMHQDDDVVAQAIQDGAAGYVLKMLAWSDLLPALHHALAGRRYLPSLTPLVMTDCDTHAIQLHGADSAWFDGIATVLSTALQRGDTIATALTQSNRESVALRMKRRGCNLDDAEKQGRYLVFDAEEAASQVMRSGWPDVESVGEMVAPLEMARTSRGGGASSHMTIVGEIAAALCNRGNPEAALELERLWDELTHSLPILTICTYPITCFDRAGAVVSGICSHHSVVQHAFTP